MKTLKLAVMTLVCIFLTGCEILRSGYSVKPLSPKSATPYIDLVAALQKEPSAMVKQDDMDAAAFEKLKVAEPLLAKKCFYLIKTSDTPDIESCTAQRNQAISALIIASSDACLAHRRSMYGNDATWNIGLGTLTNIFAGAAAVVTPETTKSILAALALFTNSERSLVNETIYKQMLVTAVDKKIVDMREDKMQTIYSSLKGDIKAYSAHEALRDVVALHNSCSFIDGLQKSLAEGTQDTSIIRMARLRTNLQILNAERNSISASAPNSSEQSDILKNRIKLLNDALQAEEIK